MAGDDNLGRDDGGLDDEIRKLEEQLRACTVVSIQQLRTLESMRARCLGTSVTTPPWPSAVWGPGHLRLLGNQHLRHLPAEGESENLVRLIGVLAGLHSFDTGPESTVFLTRAPWIR